MSYLDLFKPLLESSGKKGRHMSVRVLVEQYRLHKEASGHSVSVVRNLTNLLHHLDRWGSGEQPIGEVRKESAEGFIRYLAHEAKEERHGGMKPLKKSTANLYLGLLSSSFNWAVREGWISRSPFDFIGREERKPLREKQDKRDFLTIEELRRLINTPLRCKVIKQAFLFACFTGLRISDISRLRWSDIQERNQGKYISLAMQKTKEIITVKLSQNALRWMPERESDERVFPLPRFLGSVNGRIKSWSRRAGIDKRVSFHTSRHTFATMQLSLGTDLYVVSKLLGHASVSTTQIYADIIDRRRDEAIDRLDSI